MQETNPVSSELTEDNNRTRRDVSSRRGKKKHRRRRKIRGHPKKSKSGKKTQLKKKPKARKQTRSKHRQSIVFEGENCQFVDFGSVGSSGSGCVDGTKMVLKNKYASQF